MGNCSEGLRGSLEDSQINQLVYKLNGSLELLLRHFQVLHEPGGSSKKFIEAPSRSSSQCSAGQPLWSIRSVVLPVAGEHYLPIGDPLVGAP
jgi:hypothetical protein